ncbi:MAG: hypothetical protein GEV06_04520 [Luteitalea sp.]|nr:hypothetical protein [Luteitalea sp.]
MSRPVLIAGLIVGCVTAAGLGSYMATRHVAQSAPVAAAPGPSSATSTPDAVASDEAATDGTLIDLQQDASSAEESDPAAPSADPGGVEPSAAAVEEAPRTTRSDRERATRRQPEVEATTPPASARTEPSRETARATERDSAPVSAPIDDVPDRPDSSEEPAASPAALPVESRSAEPVASSAETVAVLEQPEGLISPRLPQRENVTVEPDAVVGLRIENTISSATAEVEDRVEARATRDVLVGDLVAIPAGTELRGSVVEVDRGGRLKGGARLGVRFHTVVLDDGTEVPLRTETIYRDGTSSSDKSTAKIGGATVGGAILGAILGGGKGAAIGAAAGAGGGTAAAMSQRAEPAVLRAGSNVTVRLTEPFTIEVEY